MYRNNFLIRVFYANKKRLKRYLYGNPTPLTGILSKFNANMLWMNCGEPGGWDTSKSNLDQFDTVASVSNIYV